MPSTTSKKVYESSDSHLISENDKNCWPLFSIYIMYLLTFITIVLTIIINTGKHLDYTNISNTNINSLHVLECISYLFSMIGFLIFSIRPLLTFIKQIFEELTPKDSFKHNIKILIRSQWFLMLLSILFFCMKDNFYVLEPVSLIVIIINLVIDLKNVKNKFDGNEENGQYANILSLLFFVMMFYVENYYVSLYFLIAKLILFGINYYSDKYVKKIDDVKVKRKMWLLHLLLVVNGYLVGYGMLRSMGCFVDMNVSENEMFLSIWNILKLMVFPNLGKILPYFFN